MSFKRFFRIPYNKSVANHFTEEGNMCEMIWTILYVFSCLCETIQWIGYKTFLSRVNGGKYKRFLKKLQMGLKRSLAEKLCFLIANLHNFLTAPNWNKIVFLCQYFYMIILSVFNIFRRKQLIVRLFYFSFGWVGKKTIWIYDHFLHMNGCGKWWL